MSMGLSTSLSGMDSLPNELLLDIWQYLHDANDIRNFALTSKRTYATAGDAIRKYRSFQLCYSSAKVWIRGDVSPALDLLKAVLSRPYVGTYVETLHVVEIGIIPYYLNRQSHESLVEHAMLGGYFGAFEEEALIYSQKDNELITKASNACEFVRSNYAQMGWEWGYGDPILALLLTHLPNLRTLSFDEFPEGKCTMDLLVHSTTSPYASALQRLVNLDLNTVDGTTYRHRKGQNMSILTHFALLPRLRNVKCYGVNDEDKEMYPSQGTFTRHSHITSLDFEQCGPITKKLHEVLAPIPTLKSFKYSEDNHGHNLHKTWEEPLWIRNSLLVNASHSLETFVFHSPNSWPQFMGSLRGFQNLKILDTRFRHIIDLKGPLVHTDLNTLPNSIEHLTLSGNREDIITHARMLVHFLCLAKSDRMLKMKRLVFKVEHLRVQEFTAEEFFEMWEMCDKNGVTFGISNLRSE